MPDIQPDRLRGGIRAGDDHGPGRIYGAIVEEEPLALAPPVADDGRGAIMHDKFIVIDGATVWTGSMNFTENDAYRNNNNCIAITSSQLAENYTREFEEMFVSDQFGPDSPANTPNPTLTIDGSRLEVYFSPDDGVLDHLLDVVDNAQESIYFLAFSFTADPLAEAIIARSQNGVTVAGVMEESQAESNIGGDYKLFITSGVKVLLDGNPRNMHHKVIIIDKQTIITGSYNFSANAENINDENLVIIRDHLNLCGFNPLRGDNDERCGWENTAAAHGFQCSRLARMTLRAT